MIRKMIIPSLHNITIPDGDIEVLFQSPPSNPVVSIAPIKHNLKGVFMVIWDDSSKTVITSKSFFNSKTFKDGAGGFRNWTGSVALIGKSSFNDNEYGLNPDNVLYTEMPGLVQDGYALINHGLYSDKSVLGTASQDITGLNELILERVGYKLNTIVVPGNEVGYVSAGLDLGFLGVTSQRDDVGQDIGLPSNPSADYMPLATMSSLDILYNYLLRSFADGLYWADGQLVSKRDQMLEDVEKILIIGSHNTTGQQFIDYINSSNIAFDGNIWVTSFQEFLEYVKVKNTIQINQQIINGKLVIDLDYSNVPVDLRWKDVTLMISDGANAIQSISVNGYDNSFNTQTGLINIFNEV